MHLHDRPEEPTLSQVPNEPPLKRLTRTPTLWIVLGTLVFLLVISFIGQSPKGEEITFTDFQKKVAAGEVKTAKILQGEQA